MKTIRGMVGGLIAVWFITSNFLAHAQTELQSISAKTEVPDSVVRIAAEAKGLSAVSPKELPRNGTYWLVTGNGGFLVPYPGLPDVAENTPVFSLGSPGQFLVDGTGGVAPQPSWRQAQRGVTAATLLDRQGNAVLALINQVAEAKVEAEQAAEPEKLATAVGSLTQLGSLSRMSLSGAGGSGPNSLESESAYGTNLWLEIPAVTNGAAYVVLHNVVDGEVYELMTKLALPDPAWLPELALHTVTNQDWIGATVPMLNRTNALFFWARDWTGIDENTNSMPDWWEWENFHDLNQTANGDYDGDGMSNSQEYLNGTDPNNIQFTLKVPNNYVIAGATTVPVVVSKGVPAYCAVVVDSTNFAGASWNTYASSNITVNLGANEGWHNIWIGLRGRLATSDQTWQWKRLKLDRTPPLLVITNPTSLLVSQPMIQLQGFSPEALSQISCNISNAAGVLTNQQVLILDQYYDTNTWEFTTNTFQAFDIDLADGNNTITFHATDLAGNVATTNFNFTLNYSCKTNLPVVQLFWPTNGTQISGSRFTWRGLVEDFTASVTATLVATNGSTNIFKALVERDGKFWVENIPLPSGTNFLTLNVTDVVGNTATTNISVIKNTLVLAMNPVIPAQLWQPTVNLTGIISDAEYAVWVNGVKGTNNGNGTWTANSVPVNKGGTASFLITAYLPSEQQPDGSYGN